MNRFLSLGAMYCCFQIASIVHAAGGTDDIAHPGKPVNIDLTGHPDGTQALVNHDLRADGWRPWLTEWPNDVMHFSFDARTAAEVQAILDTFAAIKVRGKQVRLSALPEPANHGWVSRIPEGRKIAVLFTTGDQATVDAWYKRVRKPFGQIEFTAAPVAVPPTLTIFVGNPAVKLSELKIPQEVEVIHGNVPGKFHVWNDKEANKAAAQIPVSPAHVKLVAEINAYIEQRAVAATKPNKETPAKEIESVPRECLLEYSILWDEECLLSYDFFGLKTKDEFGERVAFYYGRANRAPEADRPQFAAMAVIPLRDEKIHGKVRRWAEDGTLLVEIPYRAGQIDGECRFYNRKGKLLGTSMLKEGTGIYRIWDRTEDEPVLVREIIYAEGLAESK